MYEVIPAHVHKYKKIRKMKKKKLYKDLPQVSFVNPNALLDFLLARMLRNDY